MFLREPKHRYSHEKHNNNFVILRHGNVRLSYELRDRNVSETWRRLELLLKSLLWCFQVFQPRIRLDHTVKNAVKKDSVWQMEYENGRVFTSTFLVLCSGNVQLPNRLLEDTLRKDFEGEIHHSCTFKSFVPEHKGKRVMLIGGEKQPVMLWRNGVTTLSALYGAFHAPPPLPRQDYPIRFFILSLFSSTF